MASRRKVAVAIRSLVKARVLHETMIYRGLLGIRRMDRGVV